MEVKIGYQGEIGSNADFAAHQMSANLGFFDVVYIPLISSQRVITALKLHEIDYGVVAIQNTIGGIVEETSLAIQNEQLEEITTIILDIHHCLYKFPGVDNQSLKYVASHIQALKQTRKTRRKLFPELREMKIEDTAIGAKWLANGELSKEVAILCRDTAGEIYNLELMKANLEDTINNKTEFKMFKLFSNVNEE